MYLKRFFNKKNIITIIAIAIFLFSMSGYTKIRAQENVDKKVLIIFENNEGKSDGFCDDDGFWYPGMTLTKQFVIKNNHEREIEFDSIGVEVNSVSNYVLNKIYNPDENIYKEFLENLIVQLKSGDNVIFEGTFDDFNNSRAKLSSPIKIKGNDKIKFLLTVHFEEKAGNTIQGLKNLFNLKIQYVLKDGSIVVDDVTILPKTGSFFNFTTLVAIGLAFTGIGFLIVGYREETSLKKGGLNNEK